MAENYALISESGTMYKQTDSLKDIKDVSQNLMSGDFERQYRNRTVQEGGKRRQACCVTFAVTLTVVVIALSALTVAREIHIRRLCKEVEELSAHIVAVEANVNALNQKISNNRLFNEFKTLDTIYTDDDQEEAKDSDKDKQDYGILEKLHNLTILEDDSMPDDDLSDDDDLFDESGDYYQDYDRRRENAKPGSTNMVLLDPEDFTDPIVKFNQEDKSALSKIRKIQRMLNENPENPDIALAAAPSMTNLASSNEREKRSVFPDTPIEMVEPPAFTVADKLEERRKSKKYLPPPVVPAPLSNIGLHTVTRTVRNSDSDKPFIAAHFHGNTSHLNPEIHEHYKGNGLVRVSHDQPHNVWYPSTWTINAPHPRPTLTRGGHVHVHHSGVYLVYVQIYYLDSHDVIAWVLHRTNPDIEGRQTLLQCAQSSHSSERLDKPNSCFSASALYLKAGDKLAVRNTGGDRHSLMEPEKSFIGLVKLGDAMEFEEEL
ncbi:unnamed protein product [Diatraea saccharalis]|uniref:THD domain-containing protein n=1 Tax=Diatraea saccharalis TaxID=40085 RepID=A0A9N9WM38_9NEOP|nr:unnamed protein product [Diatraea saccharalis]